MNIDLSLFCGTDKHRPHLHQPFSRGDWTYATNGHILVRQPRRTDVPEVKNSPNPEKLFAAVDVSLPSRPLPVFEFPTPERTTCLSCEGRGTEHDCPDCQCECEICGGRGERVERITAGIGATSFSAKYIAMLAALPDIKVPAEPPIDAAMYFTFDGGDGLLMPMKSPAERHIVGET